MTARRDGHLERENMLYGTKTKKTAKKKPKKTRKRARALAHGTTLITRKGIETMIKQKLSYNLALVDGDVQAAFAWDEHGNAEILWDERPRQER